MEATVSLDNYIQIIYTEGFFYNDDGKRLEQVAQRGGEYPIPGNIQGQVKDWALSNQM